MDWEVRKALADLSAETPLYEIRVVRLALQVEGRTVYRMYLSQPDRGEVLFFTTYDELELGGKSFFEALGYLMEHAWMEEDG